MMRLQRHVNTHTAKVDEQLQYIRIALLNSILLKHDAAMIEKPCLLIYSTKPWHPDPSVIDLTMYSNTVVILIEHRKLIIYFQFKKE